MTEIMFKLTHDSRDTQPINEIVSENKIEERVQEILNFTRNVAGFRLTVERIQ